jgi:hypothetical protein
MSRTGIGIRGNLREKSNPEEKRTVAASRGQVMISLVHGRVDPQSHAEAMIVARRSQRPE